VSGPFAAYSWGVLMALEAMIKNGRNITNRRKRRAMSEP
jgi:hypothetical protein